MNQAVRQPLVSVVILCWNRKADVHESLTRLREQTWTNREVIVVDNASSDGTQEMIRDGFTEVRLLEMTDNMGIEAYNYGFNAARGEYLVILDDDSFPAADALEKMVGKFQADPQLGIVAFDVRNYASYDATARPGSESSSSAAAARNYLLAFNGAGAGVRRKVMEETGGYASEFFLYWNEQDMAFRVLNAGWKIDFFPDVVSYHKYSPRNRASWRAPYFYTRNAFWLVWKHYPLDMALRRTLELIFRVCYHSLEQRTFIYLQAFWAAIRQSAQAFCRRRPVKREIARNLRIPLDVAFTFFR